MAVDYFHRLLVSGKPADVRAFRDAIYREYPRTIAGKTWTEIVPFSFTALYELAPAARRVEGADLVVMHLRRSDEVIRWTEMAPNAVRSSDSESGRSAAW